ncbi:twin-arginine translocation signal domain-containing protein [Streptomyces sp. NBC_01340]|uniref:twin-arginine translocation signal domain-containing protein n=1 Tax=Streptomyces sp. NBC_01340 TaxID=2903830 RepID=UPI002E12AE36|nr:twin-arginine translocation signal domain-containing protein [Streptomyces sp. NBC_01340]
MSSISRRSLLGYSGTAAAGAVLTTGGAAQAAEADAPTAAAVHFPNGTEFKGSAFTPGREGGIAFTFSVEAIETAPESYRISSLEVANALNELATSRGWPPITFYGTPAPAPLG